jgi:hypothetical protein
MAGPAVSHRRKCIRNYSLRTLLAIVVLAALPFAWVRGQYDRVAQESRVEHELKRIGFLIGYDYRGHSAAGIPWSSSKPRGNTILRSFLGADFFAGPVEMVIQDRQQFSAQHYATVTDSEIKLLANLPDLRILNLDDCAVSDQCLSQIAAHQDLELLSIRNTRITPGGVRRLQQKLPLCEICCDRSP